MPSYLVEIYMPRSGARDVQLTANRVRSAVDEVARECAPIRFVRTTFLPDDETCFYLFEADSVAAVDAVCSRARLGHARIVTAVEGPTRLLD